MSGERSRQEAAVVSRLAALRTATARIGTTLDEVTTWEELTREAALQTRGTAAVLRADDQPAGRRYEAVRGDPALLPEARWAAAIAQQEPGGNGAGETSSPSGGTPTALCVPVTTGGDSYGTLVCGRDTEPFTRWEVEACVLLAERAASHIRQAREHQQVSGLVGMLQSALRVEPGRPHPNLDIATRYLPAGQSALVGGDWCETIRLHFGRTLLVVGDVMGHGLEAAVDMTAYRSTLRSTASADLPPHRVLRQLDDIAAGEPDRRPATCLIARVDPAREQVTLASAGHLPPAVIDTDGKASLLPVPVGPPLGTGLGGYRSQTHRLSPSQTLVLFTDGLVEHRHEDIDQSLHRLTALTFAATTGPEQILDTLLSDLDTDHAEDDIAVLAARVRTRTDTTQQTQH
ncbi:GAF domain-containing SpoIIE family protein phosphatase [Streptomyces sp. NPDC048324]|uniref:PP2C family protein-serine/threonine phosphatase n=1 Tax=Streptomyces sp. NPDC048324 TaxID=3157205 RepID=UPI0034401CAA